MNKKSNKFRQFLIFPLLYLPYLIAYDKVIAEYLGDGFTKLSPGSTIFKNFNGYDFPLLFWSVIGVIVIIMSLFKLKYIEKLLSKVFYMLQIVCLTGFLVIFFSYSNRIK